MTKPTKIIVPRNGIHDGSQEVRAVYDAGVAKMLPAVGAVTTVRASHVEPGAALSQAALSHLGYEYAEIVAGTQWQILQKYASHWFADMTPTGHDTVLGPYNPDQRDTALETEVNWLHAHNIPTCSSCTANPTPI